MNPDAFTYIVTLQLIIVALGITKILEGIIWVVEHRDSCKLCWFHILAFVIMFVLQMQHAWSSFYDHSVVKWTFGDFLLQCTAPLTYLFVAVLLLPKDADIDRHQRTGESDPLMLYRRHIRLIASLVIAAQIINSVLEMRYHPGASQGLAKHAVRLGAIMVLFGLFAPLPKWRWLHGLVFAILAIALLYFCIWLTPAINIKPPVSQVGVP